MTIYCSQCRAGERKVVAEYRVLGFRFLDDDRRVPYGACVCRDHMEMVLNHSDYEISGYHEMSEQFEWVREPANTWETEGVHVCGKIVKADGFYTAGVASGHLKDNAFTNPHRFYEGASFESLQDARNWAERTLHKIAKEIKAVNQAMKEGKKP